MYEIKVMTYTPEILLARMVSMYGLVEVNGNKSNEELLKMINDIVPWADDDSTIAWCAILMTWLFMDLGMESKIPKKSLAARSWLNLEGTVIWEEGMDETLVGKLCRPGDIVIFWRGEKDGWQGHIALYVNEYHYDRSKIRVIGGNQANGILIRPYNKSQILKIIRL